MSTSPFEIFRRNLKPLMVFLTLLALFAFVVLPALQSYLQRNAGPASITDPVVASFDGLELRSSRIDYFTQAHAAVVRFLIELAETTIQSGGTPRVAGFQYDTQTNQVRDLGIPSQPSQLSTVRTLQWANEAQKLGLELDDTAIRTWLIDFTDGMMSDGEIIARLMESTNNRLGQYHLYDQLRHLLLSEMYARAGLAAIAQNGQPIVTPAEQWENFLKLNREATADAYGVLVADYMDQVADIDTTTEQVTAVYEEGKERFPTERTPEPGFRRPYVAAYEFVAIDLNELVSDEAGKLDEQQLRSEYERRLAGGDFQMPEDTPADPAGVGEPAAGEAIDQREVDQPQEATDGEADGSDPDEAPAVDNESPEQPSDNPETSQQAEATSAASTDTGAGESAPDDGGEQAQDASSEGAQANAEAPGEPSDSTDSGNEQDGEQPESAESDDGDQSSLGVSDPVRLVVFQQSEDSSAGQDQAENQPDPESTDAGSDDDQTSTDPAVTEQDASSEPDRQPQESGEQSDSDAPAADASQPTDAAETEADQAPASGGTGAATGDSETADPQPKNRPFDEVREEIARELAMPAAEKRRDAVAKQIETAMRRYFQNLAIHESNMAMGVATEAERPERPDLQAIADQFGVTLDQTEMLDVRQVQNLPISDSVDASSPLDSFSRQQPTFTMMMYGLETDQMSIPRQPLFSPIRTVDLANSVSYVAWKTDEREAYIPTLDEVRDEVIQAIQREAARELARERAEELAKKAAGETELTTLIQENQRGNFHEAVGPFSWLMPQGFGQTAIGNVRELNSIGEEFMRTVFSTQQGAWAVAPNQSESVFYVVQPTSFQPSIEELRRQFLQPQLRFMSMLIASEPMQEVRDGFTRGLDERTDFELNLDPPQ